MLTPKAGILVDLAYSLPRNFLVDGVFLIVAAPEDGGLVGFEFVVHVLVGAIEEAVEVGEVGLVALCCSQAVALLDLSQSFVSRKCRLLCKSHCPGGESIEFSLNMYASSIYDA